MRNQVETILQVKNYQYFDLLLAARLLLVTDGTVTELLEAMLREPIKLGYKKQSIDHIDNIDHTALFPEMQHQDTACLQRIITLRGSKTNMDWLYAESVILHESLNATVQLMLIEKKIPIGAILSEYVPDSHRHLIDCGIATHTAAAKRLKLDPQYQFVYRVYQIIDGTAPIMGITEWFPVDRINEQILALNG